MWALDQRLYDLPRRTRIETRRDVRQNLLAGARDVFVTNVLCKKGRPGYLVTVLCDAPKTDELAAVLFRNSTTLGVRMRTEKRICLEREWKTVKPVGRIYVRRL